MNLIFNELSTSNKPENKTQAVLVINNFTKTCETAKQYGFKQIRAESNFWSLPYFQDDTILGFLFNISRTYKSFLLSFIRKPFIAEGNENVDDKFILNDYFLNENAPELKNSKVTGLAYAYFYDTISISFKTNKIWDKTEINLTEKNNIHSNPVIVKHCSLPNHFLAHKEWIENRLPVILSESNIASDKKEIKLKDDHGKDILKAFAKKIVQSPYVVKVVNSIPFNPNEKNFIKQCFPNGQIELVLTKTDRGIGIVIQTTGRNLKETELIAEKLAEKYP